jgi:hypothetical protein
MTIKTPRVCSIPGFFVPSANLGPSHKIQCRRILGAHEAQTFASGRVDAKSIVPHRAPQGWYGNVARHPEPPARKAVSKQRPKATSEADFEVIVPGLDGKPPQRIIKPPKLRKKQVATGAEETFDAKQDNLAAKRSAVKQKRAADRDRKAEQDTLAQEIRKSVDEDWEKYYFVKLARFVGYYKKGGLREQKHKGYVYETLKEAVDALVEEEDEQRKKMEM